MRKILDLPFALTLSKVKVINVIPWYEKHRHDVNRIVVVAMFLLFALWASWLNYADWVISYLGPWPFVTSILRDVGPELAGIAIGVVSLDYLNEKRHVQELKEQLVLQMGSRHADVTHTAISGLTAKKWLYDGTLEAKVFFNANLQEADLWNANLQRATFANANLQAAHLWNANLQAADLWHANLQAAGLQYANLQEAELRYANLEGANLEGAMVDTKKLLRAKSLKGATMPDGTLFERWAQKVCDDESVDERTLTEVRRLLADAEGRGVG